MACWVTGDIHGDPRRFSVDSFPEQKEMTRDDFVIILGDFGLVWSNSKEEKYWLDWLNDKPFTTLFVDGNHECMHKDTDVLTNRGWVNIKEVYDLAYISKYKYTTLDCLYRHYEYLQFQMLLQAYTFIKYSKKVKNIPSKFIQMKNSIYENYNTSLFCLKKGAGNYSYLELYKAKIAMEYLFPIPSSYEIIDYSFLNASFNVVSYMDKNIKYYKNKISTMITKEEFFYSFLNLIVLLSLLFLKLYYFHLY